MKTSNCIVCNQPISIFGVHIDCKDGSICTNCIKKNKYVLISQYNKSINFADLDLETISKYSARREAELNEITNFKADLEVSSYAKTYAKFNDKEQKAIFLTTSPLFGKPTNNEWEIVNYNQICRVDVIRDNNIVTSSDGAGKALAGGLLFGATGALIGGASAKKTSVHSLKNLKVNITVSDYPTPLITIPIVTSETRSFVDNYLSTADNIAAKCNLIIQKSQEESNQKEESASSININELKELKALMDEGIITEEEFTAKKKKILGI
mgnify:CR=1 FL=1|nr:SHOCT domain-containing protein [uncultured Lachnoclostridium sp.]